MPLPQIQVLRNFQKRGQLGTSLWDKIYHGGVAVGEQVYLLSPLAVHLKPTTEVCNPPLRVVRMEGRRLYQELSLKGGQAVP